MSIAHDNTIARLLDDAMSALDRGEWALAIHHFATLETFDASNPKWPRQLGETYRRMGQMSDAVSAFERAASLSAKAGDAMRAAVISKEILAIDPTNQPARERLAQVAPLTVVRGEPSYSQPPAWIQNSPHAPLDGATLRELATAQPPKKDDADANRDDRGSIFEIPLEDALDDEPLRATWPSEMQRAETADLAQATLPKTPLFSQLSADSFVRLIEGARLVRLPKGVAVFHQGDEGNSLFVVGQGTVRVLHGDRVLSELEEGAIFGEIALITDEPRSATVVAATDVRLLEIDRVLMHEVMQRDGWVITVLLRFLRDRVLERLMQTHPLFRSVPPEDRETLTRRARFVEVQEKKVIIRQGEGPRALYILIAGHVEVTIQTDSAREKLATLGPGDLIGEMSLLSRSPAVASVRATSRCFAIELPAATFYQLIGLYGDALDWVKTIASARKRPDLAPAPTPKAPPNEGQAATDNGRIDATDAFSEGSIDLW